MEVLTGAAPPINRTTIVITTAITRPVGGCIGGWGTVPYRRAARLCLRAAQPAVPPGSPHWPRPRPVPPRRSALSAIYACRPPDGLDCAMRAHGCLRARPSTPPRPPQCRRNASPNGQTTVVAEAVRPISHGDGARRSLTARTRSAPRKLYYTARPCGHVLRDARPWRVPARGPMERCCATPRARESNDESHATMRAAPAAAIGRAMPCALTPACIGACGRRRRGLVPFEHHPTVPTTHST